MTTPPLGSGRTRQEPLYVAWHREKAQMSQRQAGLSLGLSHTTISLIENGQRNASAAILEGMAGLFGCYVGQLERRVVAKYVTPEPRRTAAVRSAP